MSWKTRFLGKAAFAALALSFSGAAAQSIAPVAVETLGGADTFSLGTLTPADGALPASLWRGAGADGVKYLLNETPTAGASPTLARLVRRALLSPGRAPEGADAELTGARLMTLVRAGFVEDARAAAGLSAGLARDVYAAEALAAADLLSGDVRGACLRGADLEEGREAPYWLKLRAFCYAEAGEGPAAELTLELLRDQGGLDPTTDALLADLILGADNPGLQLLETPLHYAIAKASGMEMTETALLKADIALHKAVAADETLSIDTRLASAIKVHGAGAMTEDALGALFASMPFEPTDVAAVIKTPSSDGSARSLALLYQALQATPPLEASAPQSIEELADPGLAMAPVNFDAQLEAQGPRAAILAAALLGPQDMAGRWSMASLYLEDLAGLIVDDQFRPYAPVFAMSLMAAGRMDMAERWLALGIAGADNGDALALAEAEEFLNVLKEEDARAINILGGAGPEGTAGLVKTQDALSLGLGRSLSRARLDHLSAAQETSAPPFALRAAIDAAASDDAAGVAALAAAAVSQRSGFEAAYEAVRALKAAGLAAEARKTAFEMMWDAKLKYDVLSAAQ